MTKGKLYEGSFEPMESTERVVSLDDIDEAKEDIKDKLKGPYSHWSPEAELKIWETWFKKQFGDED